MRTETLGFAFVFLGGDKKKGKPGVHGEAFFERYEEKGWFRFPTAGSKRPWGVQRYTKDLLRNGKFHRRGGVSYFKTETKARQACHARIRADRKAQEQLTGSSPKTNDPQKIMALTAARAKWKEKCFPDTTALREQIEQTGPIAGQDHALRKALAIDLSRLKRTPDLEITSSISLDQKFTASLEKAWSSTTPLDPVDEEIVLNWVALYSEDLPNDYGDKIRAKTGSKSSNDAIKRRVYRHGLRVAEKFQKPKPKAQ